MRKRRWLGRIFRLILKDLIGCGSEGNSGCVEENDGPAMDGKKL